MKFLHVVAAADLTFNNRFQHVPVLGLSCSPLAKQDSWISKDCIFKLISTDSKIVPLDTIPYFDGFDLQNHLGQDNLPEKSLNSEKILSIAHYREDLNYLNLKLNQLPTSVLQNPTD